MQTHGVVGVGPQVGQSVLVDVARDALLLGAGALHDDEEAVTRDGGARGRPDEQGAVLGDVVEAQAGGGVRLWSG